MPVRTGDWERLGTASAAIVLELGTPGSIGALADLLRALVPADDITAVLFRRGQLPELLLDLSGRPDSGSNLALYLKGAYLLDPYYIAFDEGIAPGCYRLQELAPAAFRSSEYFRVHYARTGFSDEIGFLSPLADGTGMHVSLGIRGTRARYSPAFQQRLRAFSALVDEVGRRLWAAREHLPQQPLNTQFDSALRCFGRDFLTEREAEVIQLLLRGHATKSIAERLGISPETVKLHRKHSYAKLDVSSQAELFHLFIDALGSVGSYRGGDPLTGYLTRR